jgi:luciferase-like monooxygenase
MMLALTAQRTERIGLGPGVLVPSLRHPVVNAAATAALEAMAPPAGPDIRRELSAFLEAASAA